MTGTDAYKRQAALKAVEYVESGMVVGLGHGSTAIWAVRRIAEMLQSGELRDIVGVPCSSQVQAQARKLGMPLAGLFDHPRIDITIDGADEIAPNLDVIKGGGGALLHEKVVAQASRRLVIVADESKLSPALGTNHAIPVEVLRFGLSPEHDYLRSVGGKPKPRQRKDGMPFETDEGNLILDCAFGPLADPAATAAMLDARAAIVGHGLFIGLATDAVVAGPSGIRVLSREA